MLQLPYRVILASSSPRRRELLGSLIEKFEVISPEIDEEAMAQPNPVENARHLACSKAFKVHVLHEDALVIGADTVVSMEYGGEVVQLAKPKDAEDAKRMLGMLSGQTHTVTTGVSVNSPKGRQSWATQTEVVFRSLTSGEIDEYVSTGEHLDKAGAYGAQDKGRVLIQEVRGSLTNVIGLPMEDLETHLRKLC